MKHKHLTISALALILMSAYTEATGVEGTGVEPDTLAGAWTATSIVFTSIANPTLSVDEVAHGATMSLTLGADGTFSWTFVFPGEPTENQTGTYTVSGNIMTITESVQGHVETIAIVRGGDTLTLVDTLHFTDGVEEAAGLVITLTR